MGPAGETDATEDVQHAEIVQARAIQLAAPGKLTGEVVTAGS